MQPTVQVALAQIEVDSLDARANTDRILRTCAGAAGADLIVFPELANIGQVTGRDRDFGARYLAAAEPIPGPFTADLGAAAHRHGSYLVAGMAERHPTIPYTAFNSAVLIGPDGEVLGVQRKLHLPGDERHYFAAGDAIGVFATDLGAITLQICYDAYFPEVARTAALRGAEILCGIFNLTHRPQWPDRLAHLAAVRAYENMQHVVMVNRVGANHGKAYGGESAVAVPPGAVAARGPAAEPALVRAVLPAEALARERAFRPVFADRRPDAYDLDDPGRARRPGGGSL